MSFEPVIVTTPTADAYPAERVDALTSAYTGRQVVQRLVSGVTVVAGLPNSGKSAMALDMALAITAHSPWFGRKVSGGPVLYVASEASGSAILRARASIERKWSGRKLPLYLCGETPALGDELTGSISAARLCSTVEEVSSLEGERVAMVVIDTVSATLAGSDENGGGMVLLAGAATRIHNETGAAVMLIHHPGKGEGNSLRGHSSLSGSADVICVLNVDTATKVRTLTVTKARDFAIGEAIHFELEGVELAERDCFGDPLCTVIVRPTDKQPTTSVKVTGKNQATAMVALREWTRSNPDIPGLSSTDLAALLQAQGIAAKRKPEALNWLVNAGVLTPSVGGFVVNRGQL